jgi:hypothetical protein
MVCNSTPNGYVSDYTTFRKKGAETWARKTLLAINVSMFILSTSQFGGDLASFLAQVNTILLASATKGETLEDKVLRISLPVAELSYSTTAIFSFEFLLGDVIVIWRAWAVWGQNWKVVAVPCFLWVSSAGEWIHINPMN